MSPPVLREEPGNRQTRGDPDEPGPGEGLAVASGTRR